MTRKTRASSRGTAGVPVLLPIAALLLTAATALTGCASASERLNAHSSAPTAGSASPTDSAVQLQILPAPGASAVPPDEPVVVTAAQGKLQLVRLTGPAGDVSGVLGPDATTWTSTDVLAIGAVYSVSATAVDRFGLERTITSTFTTLTPAEGQTVRARVSPLDGETVGVGMPVVLYLTEPVQDRVGVEQRLSVTSQPPVEGAWHWVTDEELHWRPKELWPAGTQVTVDIPLTGVSMGEGRWGDEDRVISFSVTEHAVTSIVDISAKNMQVQQDGKVLRTLPITAGRVGWETRNGTKVVLSKEPERVMDAETVGIGPSSPDYYSFSVQYAMRLTWSGEFVHASPRSQGSLGAANVSYGSVGLSNADAAWLYDLTTRGDIVRVIGSPRPLELGNGYTDWNVDWDEWVAGGALAAATASPTASS